MPFTPKAPIDLALKERIRVAYYDEERTVAEVEEVAGVGRATLYRWFHAWGWPLRKPMRSRPRGRHDAPAFRPGGEPGAVRTKPADGEAPAATASQLALRDSLKTRLKRLVEHRIAVLEHEAMTGVAIDPEANAVAIERNARTLVTIERLGGSEPEPCPHCGGGKPARSLQELRDSLRAHLVRICGERDGVVEDEDEGGGEAGPDVRVEGPWPAAVRPQPDAVGSR